MQSFRTIIHPKPSKWRITHEDRILMLGSCFTDSIGERLLKEKFDVNPNPLGTLFHPNAIAVLIKRAVEEKYFQEEEFFQDKGLWHHWELNHKFSSRDLKEQLGHANAQLALLRSSLIDASYIFITLGTAWVYKNKETRGLVSNCHKVPAVNFEKQCSTVIEIKDILQGILESANELNSNVKVVFTVSPVRHWKDGAEENFKSKSILRSAIDKVMGENSTYFPSYEIMMDDLRDYRFYKEDMVHPSDQAVDYIYAFFAETYYTEETKGLIKKVNEIVDGENHRAINPDSEGHLAFLEKIKKNKMTLFEKYAYLESRW